jgi:hypothetical protein
MPYRRTDSTRFWDTDRDTGRITNVDLLKGFEHALQSEADLEKRARITRQIHELERRIQRAS